ncbi:MAG: c-type cytochrome [Gemmobacter sp.]
MKRTALIATLTALALAGTAIAQEATLPEVKARKQQMQEQRMAVAVLGDMASGKTAFDAGAAAAAKAALAELGVGIPAKFEAEVTEAASKAKPEIWMMWDDFVVKSEALTVAANALDASSLDGVRAGMPAIGGSCQACHQLYRN